MKLKPVLTLWPAGLLMIAGSAYADLSPYSLTASETIEHESNVAHTTVATADWLSTTELRAGLDQALGRDRLAAGAEVDFDRYLHSSALNNTGYALNGEFDWSTIDDLSGSIGGDSSRKQYIYGLDGEAQSSAAVRNSQTTNHVFARAQLGGVTRWTVYGGVDATQRKYSDPAFAPNEVRQWSGNAGTRYQTSPDLTFGIVGSYTNGSYPHAVLATTPTLITGSDGFSIKSIDATSTWQASGASSFDLRAGYTSEDNDIQPQRKYWNGDLIWNWTLGGRIKIRTELERDTDADATFANGGAVASNNLAGHSLNTSVNLGVTYELTAKINLLASAQYTERKYAPGTLPIELGVAQPSDGSGENRTTQFTVAAHYAPILNTDLSCSFAREVRRSDAQIVLYTPAYTANTVLCAAQIQFR